MTSVSVVIPAHNAAATLGRTLGALANQDLAEDFEVVVVDDGSDDDTVATAERAPFPVTLLRQSGEGAARARNRGAAAAAGAVLAFTDADCLPSPSWLRRGLRALGGADLVQGAVSADPSVPRGPFDRSLWVVEEVGLYESANLFVRRELFDRLGGFEEWIRIGGRPFAEDLWLGWRARRANARVTFAVDAVVHHAVVRRGPREYIDERRRYAYFPDVARKVPEIRATLFYKRRFLSRRTASFDVAAGSLAVVAVTRSRLPLLAAAPYAWSLARQAARWGRRAPLVVMVNLVADGVGLVALLRGSVRARSPVL